MALDHVAEPSPHDRSLSSITVVLTSGPIAITCAAGSGELYIRGGSPQLDLLAANVQGFAEGWDGDDMSHLHIDYFPGHDCLDESSEPSVLGIAG
ncbi:Imm32 family immunity protein [Lentzea atacamensis]